MFSTISREVVQSVLDETKPQTKNQKVRSAYITFISLKEKFPHLAHLVYYTYMCNKLHSIMQSYLHKKKFTRLSSAEKDFITTMISCWTDKNVAAYFKIMEQEEWLGAINVTFSYIKRKPLISEKQLMIIKVFLAQYDRHKNDIKLIKKEDPEIRDLAYRSIVEHEYISPVLFKEVLPEVTNEKIRDRMKYVQNALVRYSRLPNKTKIHHSITKKYPLSDFNFAKIENELSKPSVQKKTVKNIYV